MWVVYIFSISQLTLSKYMEEMGAPLTPQQGIETILYLIFYIDVRDKLIFNGKFFAEKNIISFW